MLQRVGPIAAVPWVITNTAALTPYSLAAGGNGTLWSVYRHGLWRLNVRGLLQNVRFPPGVSGVRTVLAAEDGSLWNAASVNGQAALLQFRHNS